MDPIVGDWTKTVLLVGTMHCRFSPDGTGVARGKVLGHNVHEPFTWEARASGIYHICAHGEEHDIRLCGDRLETEFRGYCLDMCRVRR